MKRRELFTRVGGAAVAAWAGGANPLAASPPPQALPHRRARMTAGCQRSPTSETMLMYFRRHGIDHICGYPDREDDPDSWTADALRRLKDRCDAHGVSLDMVQFPFMASSHVDRSARKAIMLGQDPERRQEVDEACQIIRNCAAAGIPAIKYNLSLLGVLRTEPTPGRGGSLYSTWRLREAKEEPPLTRAGTVPADAMWERITYFLERVVPVAEEYRIRLACHPHDPGVPERGFRGVVRVLGTVEGLKRFVDIRPSPYHGLNLCLGTTAEMLQDPGSEIHDVIRHFGARGEIFNIHFRNIRGRRDDFQEVFPDEGDMDMWEVMKTLKEVDYAYMVMPDHMPRHADDPQGLQAFAFGYGYIKALIQAVDALA
jgi:mannonate dehydratase